MLRTPIYGNTSHEQSQSLLPKLCQLFVKIMICLFSCRLRLRFVTERLWSCITEAMQGREWMERLTASLVLILNTAATLGRFRPPKPLLDPLLRGVTHNFLIGIMQIVYERAASQTWEFRTPQRPSRREHSTYSGVITAVIGQGGAHKQKERKW